MRSRSPRLARPISIANTPSSASRIPIAGQIVVPFALVTAMAIAVAIAAHPAGAQRLFVGLEGSPTPPTRSSDLAGFPDVTWDDHFIFDVNGATARPDGVLYLCSGAYPTEIYEATLESGPEHLCTSEIDLAGLAYGRGTLWGYSNYATPKGIYAIDPATGDATLVLDVYTGNSFRFFALGYNPIDDLLYGYTEYGTTGLYSINIDTGEMLQMAGRIPASNGQGRGLAVGNHTVYLTATRGDDAIPLFAYDLAQGPGGEWVAFTQPYPDHHSNGGAAWIPEPFSGVDESGGNRYGDDGARVPGWLEGLQLCAAGAHPVAGAAGVAELLLRLPRAAQARLTVHDVGGRVIAILLDGSVAAGEHRVEWRPRDHRGTAVSPGIYFALLRAGSEMRSCRITVIR